jgi:hypothetical protein
VVDGEEVNVEVTAQMPILPGANGVVEIVFPRPRRTASAQRFLLLRGDHICGAGFDVSGRAGGH